MSSRGQFVAFSLLVFVSCLFSTSTGYGLPRNGSGILQNVRRPDLCLSVTGPGSVGLANCDLTSPQQNLWTFTWNKIPLIPRVIQFTVTTMLAAVEGDSMDDGARIYLTMPVAPNYPKWAIINGALDGTFQLSSVTSGKCLTAEAMGPLQGLGPGASYLDQWGCGPQAANTHQFWRFIQAPHVSHEPVMLKSSTQPINCLDNLGANSAPDAPVGFYLCTPSAANQHWYLVESPTAVGIYMVRNRATDKCMQVVGETATNGGSVTMRDCPDPAASPAHFLWNPVPNSEDPDAVGNRWWYENVNNQGQCLNVLFLGGGSELRDCNTGPNQYLIFQHPIQYLKTAGSLCGGPLECLSDSCSGLILQFCDKGAPGKPCQTKADCAAGICINGDCS